MQVNLKLVKAQQFHSRYSNHFQINVTPTEVQIVFGELDIAATQSGTGTTSVQSLQAMQAVELHSRITLPHALAKELMDKLRQLMVQAEKQVAAQGPTMEQLVGQQSPGRIR